MLASSVRVGALGAPGIREEEDAMPYKVIFFEKNRKIRSKVWRTKTKAIAGAIEPQLEVTSAIVVDVGANESVLAMTKAMRPTSTGEGGGRMMLSQIVIETEASGDSQTMLRLSIDKQLIAEHLNAAQAQFLIEEILDRIPIAEVGNARDHELRRSA